jgi:dolichyl-phosphate beta-glucosyltransferase
MTAQIDISLVVPAFNEAGSIATTIREASGYFESRGLTHEIIVAADGDDGTRELARKVGQASGIAVHVLGGAERGGKGRGIREGVARASGAVIGFTDADGKTPIAEYDRCIELWDEGFDLIIGSRGLAGSKIEVAQPLYRRIGSWGFGKLMRAMIGLDIPDTQCGFKFFRHDVAKDLFATQTIDGYMFDVEILHLAASSGYRIGQAPVAWRDDGDSRLDLVRGNLANMRDLVLIRLRRPPQARPELARKSAVSESSPS